MNTEPAPIRISAWLMPGVALMQRYRMMIKFATMAAVLVVPLLVVSTLQIVRLVHDYETARSEVVGARVLSELAYLVTDVQQHRTESAALTQPHFEKLRGDTQKRLKEKMTSVDTLVRQQPLLRVAVAWDAIQSDLQSLVAAGAATTVSASQYKNLVEGIRVMSLLAAENSTLVLAPYADTYFLQAVLSEHAIPWLEALSAMPAALSAQSGQTQDGTAFAPS